MKNQAGKGSQYRKVDKEKYDQNYRNIFYPNCPICNEPLDKWRDKLVCINIKCDGYKNILKGVK